MLLIPKYLYIVVTILLFSFSPAISNAAAYWLEVSGNGKTGQSVTVKLYYGSINEAGKRVPDTRTELALCSSFRFWIQLAGGSRQPLVMRQQQECWLGSFTPERNGIYRITGFNDQHPVVDRSATGGISVLPIDYLYADYTVGKPVFSSSDSTGLLLNMGAHCVAGILHIKPFINGQPCRSGTKLRVFNPDNWEKELVLDDHGEACFRLNVKGLYIVRLDREDATPGNYQAVAYQRIRHRCNYFFQYR